MSANIDARWRLASVTIRQFRGVAKERVYAFDGRPALLHGNNGVGKSTVAVALQWILFGRFQGDVLPNSKLDSFLAPVQAKGKAYSGEVVLVRGTERLELARDGAAKRFTVRLGKQSWEDDEAEAKRDELLGLDMDTFVRAVLLQQSRIRGLLLDEPKERNKALDRLLGMDAAEHLLEVVRPKDFLAAANAWRETVRDEQQRLESQEKLLGEQLEDAQCAARELRFLNKELNATGLEGRYAELSRDLMMLGRKYKVDVKALPPCDGVGKAGVVAKAFEAGVKAIRLGAELKNRLTPVEKAIASLAAIAELALEAVRDRTAALQEVAGFAKKHGDRKALVDEREQAQETLRAQKRELKDAEGLRQLLLDAHEYVKHAKPRECPVCERVLPERPELAARLRERSDGFATAAMEKVRRSVEKTEGRLEELTAALDELTALEKEAETTRKSLDKVREKAVEVLGAAVPENKLEARIGEATEAQLQQQGKLREAVAAMEADLDEVDGRERQVRAVLVPVVRKREEVTAHEAKMEAARKRHEKSEARAVEMETVASQLEVIRKALLGAKEDLANELLGKAGPRAQALYRRLVRQPVFDTLEIEANAKAAKVDYTFQVTAGPGGTGRDARLVLSDGQLTATALALFFGLAESTQHALDLLYVDDPTQNLDNPCKEAMAKVVAEIARRRQVVVSTQDEDFVTYLKAEGFPKNAIVHHIRAWDGNPTVETSTPAAD